MSSNVNQIRMDSPTEVLQAIVAPSHGSTAAHNLQQLPRTRQDVTVNSPNQEEEEELPFKYPIAPQHCRRWGKPESTIIRRGTIPTGPLHFTNPLPTLPEGWVEHTHLEGKLYYVRDGSNPIQGAPSTLTIVTDADPRNSRNLRGLENVHLQVVEAVRNLDIRLPEKVQLLIEIYPEQDDWGHAGGYYLADLDNQSIFWVEDVDSQDLGLGSCINFGVFGEQHLKLLLHRQFWYHIECYPLSGSIEEKHEYETLLKHLTFSMLDVATSGTSPSVHTASECSTFIESIEKTPENSRTWPIARIAGFMAENRCWNYYGHPSARLNRLHSFEVEQTEEDASASAAWNGQTPEESTWRQRVDDLYLRTTTYWYSVVAVWLRLCSVFFFDTPIRHHATLEDLFVDKNVSARNYRQVMKTFLDDWEHAGFLSTVLLAANMAFLTIPAPQETTYSAAQLTLLQLAVNTCSLLSTIFSIGSITLGLINIRKHRGESSYREIANLLAGTRHRRYGFRPLAIVYALPIASLQWAVVSFAGAIALYCLIATSVIPRVVVLTLEASLMGGTFVTILYYWQPETRWGYEIEGISPKRPDRPGRPMRRQRLRIADWFWDWTEFSTRRTSI